jgi:hypothetical protein
MVVLIFLLMVVRVDMEIIVMDLRLYWKVRFRRAGILLKRFDGRSRCITLRLEDRRLAYCLTDSRLAVQHIDKRVTNKRANPPE